jgi:hypothetical protein
MGDAAPHLSRTDNSDRLHPGLLDPFENGGDQPAANLDVETLVRTPPKLHNSVLMASTGYTLFIIHLGWFRLFIHDPYVKVKSNKTTFDRHPKEAKKGQKGRYDNDHPCFCLTWKCPGDSFHKN